MDDSVIIVGRRPDGALGEVELDDGNNLKVAIEASFAPVDPAGIPYVTERYARPGENVKYYQGTLSGTTTVSALPGRLIGVFVSSITGSPTLLIKDNATAMVAAFAVGANQGYDFWGMTYNTSLVIERIGVSTSIVLTVAYEPIG